MSQIAMRLPYLWLAIGLAINIGVDIYIYAALVSYCRRRVWSRIQLVTAILLACVLIAVAVMPIRTGSNAVLLTAMWMLYAYVSIYMGKYMFVVCDILSRLPCLWHHGRWKWLTRFGGCLGVAVFVLFWWGPFNRLNIEVERITARSPELPKAFEGFKIAQISDLHLGTYDNDTAFISRIVDRVNALHPDVIMFTGDLVNRRSSEARAFVPVLGRLHAKYGVYAVRGNHDYGDYETWPSASAKEQNYLLMRTLQRQMGWIPLDNTADTIKIGRDAIVVIGVENIGDPPFHTYGDLTKAYPHADDSTYKILLTHNPAHWTNDVADHDNVNIALTLSGHTHAMQLELFGLSPARMRYRTWGGLYADDRGHQLYVNRGIGTVGMPSRIGATPEITLLTLRR